MNTEEKVAWISRTIREITEVLQEDKLSDYSGTLTNGWKFKFRKTKTQNGSTKNNPVKRCNGCGKAYVYIHNCKKTESQLKQRILNEMGVIRYAIYESKIDHQEGREPIEISNLNKKETITLRKNSYYLKRLKP